MKATYHNIVKYIYRLENKIAFYPTILSLLGMFFAMFMYYLEGLNISKYIFDHLPWLLIKNVETARTILATFIGGLISIMVFSFSMVMILLNQASSNYSPRVLPGLISNRRHQVVLGIYNSCLLYCIFTLIAIKGSTGNKYELAGFSILLAIVFMIFCLGAFIYFIHSISQEIQINNIMSAIHKKAKKRLCKLIDSEKGEISNFPDSTNWHVIVSKTSGYIEDISLEAISEKLKIKNAKAEILVYKGEYVFKSKPIIKVSEEFEEAAQEDICSGFHFSKSELIEDNYLLAFKQLTEIIVKAMSPGINDPGTAINAIDYLTELLMLRMQKKDFSYYYDATDAQVISTNSISFKSLLYNVMCAVRTYCKHDIILVQKLLGMFNNLMETSKIANINYRSVVLHELDSLHEDISHVIKNKNDLEVLELEITAIKNKF